MVFTHLDLDLQLDPQQRKDPEKDQQIQTVVKKQKIRPRPALIQHQLSQGKSQNLKMLSKLESF